jgi:simple sugar transport system ATP-binding protein
MQDVRTLAGGRFSTPEPAASLIAFKDVSKRFGSFWANRGVTLDIRKGEIHALAGENGAGKSTLMKMLYGHFRPDSGRITLNGQPAHFRSPAEAQRAGIGMVHQQLLIFPRLTALENIIAGAEPSRWGMVNQKAAREKVMELTRRFGFDLRLDVRAGDAPYAHRQQIELLRILYRDAKILILDEPTSLLALPQVERFLDLLRDLRSRGCTMVFISHRLPEILAVADRISVLRAGRLTATFDARDITRERLARCIMDSDGEGRGDAEGPAPPEPHLPPGWGAPLLVCERVRAEAVGHESGLQDFSLSLSEGEIFGVGGVVGNGQSALARTVAGIAPAAAGKILFRGRDVASAGLEERLREGFRWLPANAQDDALLMESPLWWSLLLGRERQPRFQRFGWLRRREILSRAASELEAHNVAYGSLHAPVRALSGGNQQKAALARILSDSPSLVVLEQPGKGLDVAAQERLRRIVKALGREGVAFLVLSYDLEELIAMCDRIGILYRGRLMGVMESSRADREQLGRWMLGLGGSEAL